LGGEPILRRTLAVFAGLSCVSEIAVAVPDGFLSHVQAYGFEKVRHIVTGKATRAESVFAALQCFEQNDGIVLVHDAARPFVTEEIIKAVADASSKYGAAVACAPVTDTIKQVDSDGKIIATPDRRNLWQAQTPQGFTYEILMRAYAKAQADGYLAAATDDSALVERLGMPVHIVPASPSNIKITTPADLIAARAFLENRI